MTYFAPSPSPGPDEPEGSDGDNAEEPRRVAAQPSGQQRSRTRHPEGSGQSQAEVPMTSAARSDAPAELAGDPAGQPPYPPTTDPGREEAHRRSAGELAGLFPARETSRPATPTHSVIDLARHERLIAASSEQPPQEFERPVPPGFPVELPQPSARREQILLTAISWLIVLFTTLLGALGGLTWSSVQTASYRATSSVIVYPPTNGMSTPNDPAAFAKVYAQVATQAAVLQPALADAGLSMSVDQARRHLDVTAPDGAALITVRARANNAADAAALANAAANGLVNYASDRRAETGYRVSKFTPATAPTSGTRPHRAESVLIGALIGLAVGAAVVLVIRRSRRTPGRLAG